MDAKGSPCFQIYNLMKAICLLFLFTIAQCAFAQWPAFNQAHPVSCQWPAFNYTAQGFFENVFVIDAASNYNDGYLTFGRGVLCNPDSVMNYTRCYSAKCNENGDLMWWNRYDDPHADLTEAWFSGYPSNLGGAVQNHDDRIVSTFTTREENGEVALYKDYLAFLDNNGEMVQKHIFDSSLAVYAVYGLIEDPSDSTYVLHGWYSDSLGLINNAPRSSFLLKIDSLGNHIWEKQFTSTSYAHSLKKAMDGGFWICAYTPLQGDCSDGFFQNTDLVLIKTDEFGNEEDRMVIGGQCSNELATISEYEEDKIILAGRLTSFDEGTGIGTYDGFLYTTLTEQQTNEQLSDTTGFKKYLHTFRGNFVDLHALDDGSFLLVSDQVFLPESGEDIAYRTMGSILKIDSNRDSLWSRVYSYYDNPPVAVGLYPYAEHFLLDSKPTPDGGFVCSGWIEQQQQDPNPFLKTPWLFKVDSLGCLEPGCQDVGVSEIVIGLQNTMSVYPNPASSIANIAFSFPSDYAPPKNSELVVIDMQGRELLRQSATMFGKSNTTIELDVAKLPGGMYTVHWVSGNAWLDSISLIKQ
jgi:hypothetical protein